MQRALSLKFRQISVLYRGFRVGSDVSELKSETISGGGAEKIWGGGLLNNIDSSGLAMPIP